VTHRTISGVHDERKIGVVARLAELRIFAILWRRRLDSLQGKGVCASQLLTELVPSPVQTAKGRCVVGIGWLREDLAGAPGPCRGAPAQCDSRKVFRCLHFSSPPDIDLLWTDVGSPTAYCVRRRPTVVECRVALRNQRYRMYGEVMQSGNFFLTASRLMWQSALYTK